MYRKLDKVGRKREEERGKYVKREGGWGNKENKNKKVYLGLVSMGNEIILYVGWERNLVVEKFI